MNAPLQTVLMLLLVVACTVYSAWALMPAALRRKLAMALMRWPWTATLPAINRAATAPTGCGCDGCDRAAPATKKDGPTHVAKNTPGPLAAGSSVIRIVPRPKARGVSPR
jgi:hypothetical protein